MAVAPVNKPRVSDAVTRAAAQGQKMLADYSRQLYEQHARTRMFPSTLVGDRGWRSPLGGFAQPAKQSKTKSR
jgi:hypothetical protein